MTAPPKQGILNALLAFSCEAPKLRKDATNPAFRSKYTPLDTIVDQINPLLQKNQLVWNALPVHGEHGPALYYRLAHVPSGEEISGTMPLLLGKQDSQGLGSALTYARRYSLCAVLNLVGDEDDDGNAASPAGATSGGFTRPSATDPASPAQLKLLKTLVTQHKPPLNTLRLMLSGVDATGLDPSKNGWTGALKKDQASRLIEWFKSGTVPTGDSDLPNDVDAVPAGGEGGDLPWSE